MSLLLRPGSGLWLYNCVVRSQNRKDQSDSDRKNQVNLFMIPQKCALSEGPHIMKENSNPGCARVSPLISPVLHHDFCYRYQKRNWALLSASKTLHPLLRRVTSLCGLLFHVPDLLPPYSRAGSYVFLDSSIEPGTQSLTQINFHQRRE